MFGKYVGIVVCEHARPYIDFIHVQTDVYVANDIWIGRNSSIAGSIYANEAWQVLRELFAATEYLETRLK
jgi:hypothetical protein